MWYLINFIQILLIFGFSMVIMTVAIFFALIGLSKTSLWMGRHIWAPFIMGIVFSRVNIEGKENFNTDKPIIFVANHLSHFDIPVLFMSIDRPIYFIAKKELKKVPFLGWVCTAIGMIWIDRSDRTKAMESMKDAGKLIKAGKSVITFPEGTRSKTGETIQFKRGTFIIAQAGEVDIMPVAIKGTYDLNKSGSYRIRPSKVQVKYGKLIKASDFQNKSPEQLADQARKVVQDLLNE